MQLQIQMQLCLESSETIFVFQKTFKKKKSLTFEFQINGFNKNVKHMAHTFILLAEGGHMIILKNFFCLFNSIIVF